MFIQNTKKKNLFSEDMFSSLFMNSWYAILFRLFSKWLMGLRGTEKVRTKWLIVHLIIQECHFMHQYWVLGTYLLITI